MQKISFAFLVCALTLPACTQSETDTFDDEFEKRQAEVEAKAKAIEQEGAENAENQDDAR